jgi:dolichol-phosphate mannosyltransferase
VRALVTGGSGFVGSNLVRRLVRDEHDVHLLLRPRADTWRLEGLDGALTWHRADLQDREGVRRALVEARADWIFHLAVYGAYAFQTDLDAMVLTNVVGTTNLVTAALASGFQAFVNTGSSSEYGDCDHAPAEAEAPRPNSYYAVTKAASTGLCQQAARQSGAHIPTLRLYSVFGPYEDPRRLIPRLVAHGLQGRWPPLAAPDVVRDFVYVDDVVDAYLRAAQTPSPEPGAVYNIGTGVQTSLRDLTEIAARALAIPVRPSWGTHPGHTWDTRVWVAQAGRARSVLRWEPHVGVEEGLRAMAAWMPKYAKYYLEQLAA